jgi:hypothetical protein
VKDPGSNPHYCLKKKKKKLCKERPMMLGMVSHACNPSSREAEAGGLRVQSQHGLHSKTPMSKEQINKNCLCMKKNLFFKNYVFLYEIK